MKPILFVVMLFALARAQAQDSLQYFNHSRNHIKTTGMTVLGSWAVANIAVGAIGYANSDNATKYFHQMNGIWNVVNLGVAIAGYVGTKKDEQKTFNATESKSEQKKVEKIFLINGALDFVYIGGGIYLNHRGDRDNSDRLRGYGSAVILQGAFLLLFDATMYTAQKNNGNKLRNFLIKNPVTFDGQKVGMLINF